MTTKPMTQDEVLSELWSLGMEIERCAGNNNAKFHRTWAKKALELRATIAAWNVSPSADVVASYNELLLAVGYKYEGETRHETALRYLRQAENSDEALSQLAQQGGESE